MLGNDVFVAFSNKKTALSVAKIVISAGFNAVCAVLTAGGLKQKISYYECGIVICGCQFGDENINELLEDIPDGFNIILIGTPAQLEYCENERIVKLAVPINANDLLCYMDMLRPELPGRRSGRSPEDRMLIDKAKKYLIMHYNMTEPQAHRFLEKKSMDTGCTMAETARKILN
ncbi:MAG: ANTAR domain-containing protein [Firmicutes bacterium]|nr:ANTAR domain-containing protein [Bacillota bacterium]